MAIFLWLWIAVCLEKYSLFKPVTWNSQIQVRFLASKPLPGRLWQPSADISIRKLPMRTCRCIDAQQMHLTKICLNKQVEKRHQGKNLHFISIVRDVCGVCVEKIRDKPDATRIAHMPKK